MNKLKQRIIEYLKCGEVTDIEQLWNDALVKTEEELNNKQSDGKAKLLPPTESLTKEISMQEKIEEAIMKAGANLAVLTKTYEIRCIGNDGKEYGIQWDAKKNGESNE